MKNLITMLLILFSLSAFASAELEEDCIREAENFGGQNLISAVCENWIMKSAYKKEITPRYELYAWKGLSLFKSAKGIFIISGANSLLNEILDLKVDSKLEKIVILNQSKKRQILVFKATDHGDVAPQLVIEGPEVLEVQEISFKEGLKENHISGKNSSQEWSWRLVRDSRLHGDVSPTESKWSFLGF